MSLAILEINDAGVQLSLEEELICTSPGYAVLDGDKMLLGKEGLEHARLMPHWTNNRFWNQLGTEPMANSIAGVRHHADLAFSHLETVWKMVESKASEVVLIVPAYFTKEQLGLLLGMAKEGNIPVTSMVNASTISVCNQPLAEHVLYLDTSLHRTTLTILHANQQVSSKETLTVLDSGMSDFWDGWAKVIARQFIESSRFDPLHNALSEQKLFNQIPGWIENLDYRKANHQFNLEYADANYSINISTDQLLATSTHIYPQIVQQLRMQLQPNESTILFISHRLKNIPGILDSLGLIKNLNVHALEESVIRQTAYLRKEHLAGNHSNVPYIISLPASHSPLSKDDKGVSSPNVSSQPTHLLHRDHATRIGNVFRLSKDFSNGITQSEDSICTIYLKGSDVLLDNETGTELKINHMPVSGTVKLSTGDELSVGTERIRLISIAR